MPPRKRLSEKEVRFVTELTKDWDQSNAAIRAGYSSHRANNTGYQLRQKEHIKQAVDQELQKQQKRTRIDADFVLQQLQDIGGWCTTKKHWNPTGALKAYELIGKHFKMFTDRQEHTGKDGGPIEVSSDTEVATKLSSILEAVKQRVPKEDGSNNS